MYGLRVTGANPDGGEPLETALQLPEIPRKGDELAVWMGDEPMHAIVEGVFWPTYGNPPSRVPELYLRRDDGISDEEWREMFYAIEEGRAP